MFTLHETTRRNLCQLSFLALGVLPTVAVLGWGASERLTSHANFYAEQLSEQLALRVTLKRVSHPRPGVVLYHGLELADRETNQPLASCRMLEVGDSGNTFVLKLSQTEVHAERAQQLWELLSRRLRQQVSTPQTNLRLLAGDITWHAPGGSQTFTDFSGRIGPGPQGHAADFNFRIAGVTMKEPATVRVVRHAATSPPTTAFTLNTGSAALPCSVFSPVLDCADWLGARAHFRGYLWAKETPQGWDAELTGNLSDVDLDRLVTSRFPHTLSGQADVQIERTRLEQGRLLEMAGSVTAGPGVISRSLLEAGNTVLHLAGEGVQKPTASILRYDRLAFDFVTNPDGLHLIGRCSADPHGPLLVDGNDILWRQPTAQPQPLVALVRALVPQSEVQVPATRESDGLLRHLPIPSVVSGAASTSASAPRARLRMGMAVPEPKRLDAPDDNSAIRRQ